MHKSEAQEIRQTLTYIGELQIYLIKNNLQKNQNSKIHDKAIIA